MRFKNKLSVSIGKLTLLLLLIFGLIELSLWLCSGFRTGVMLSEYESRMAEQMSAVTEATGKKIIYFVGDSTVYGIGASNPEFYSLPAQLERLMQRFDPELRVINLGFPGTGTEEHLLTVAQLPENSTIIYRGGINDAEKCRKCSLMLRGNMPFRIKELFYRLFSSILPGFCESPQQKAENDFMAVMELKNHQIYTIDYPVITHHNLPFYAKGGYHQIPLFSLWKEHGFTTENVVLRQFFAGGMELNDFGHRIESLLIFNYFCQYSLLGLSPENTEPVELGEEFIHDMQQRYSGLKRELTLIPADEKDLNELYAVKWKKIIKELLSLAESLKNLSDADGLFHREYAYLEKLNVLVFHNMQPAMSLLGRVRAGEIMSQIDESTRNKAEIFYVVAKTFMGTKTYLNTSMSPYPLEFCASFMRQSGLQKEQVSVREEWEYFFPFAYADFAQKKVSVCEI